MHDIRPRPAKVTNRPSATGKPGHCSPKNDQADKKGQFQPRLRLRFGRSLSRFWSAGLSCRS